MKQSQLWKISWIISFTGLLGCIVDIIRHIYPLFFTFWGILCLCLTIFAHIQIKLWKIDENKLTQ